MTDAEWLMLTLSIYFHDMGMIVTMDEYENRFNTKFVEYKRELIQGDSSLEYKSYAQSIDDKFLYQEFVRENHANRIKEWISYDNYLGASDVSNFKKDINDLLQCIDGSFRRDIALVCESHHLDDLDDFKKYNTQAVYGSSNQEVVNLNYIAIILRIADLLHITRDRTPSITRKLINVNNPVSVIEWEKQRAVRAVRAQRCRNKDGVIDDSLEKHVIEIFAEFQGPDTAEAYFGLSSYLQYARTQLRVCNEVILKAQKTEGTSNYKFPWNDIDEEGINAIGFETKKFQFTIAQDNILQLLVGHTLYNDSSVIMRELVQNGIDAVKLQKYIDEDEHFVGFIKIFWNDEERIISVVDNGTGMSIFEIENYLLKVGESKYKNEEIKRKFPYFHSISHFGIGILTCFMLADDIEIITSSLEQEEAIVINLRKVNGSYLLRKISKREVVEDIQSHGTMIKLHVRGDVKISSSSIENDLKKWVILPEVPISFCYDDKEIKIGYDSLSDVLKKYMNDIGKPVDGKEYIVQENIHGNVTLAYVMHYRKYLSEWDLVKVGRKIENEDILPVGTCIEGIRVEFNTPGYKSPNILAIANIKDSEYQTNVARSAIELGANKKVLTFIYDAFVEYVSDQIKGLEEKNYSKAWAFSESSYLINDGECKFFCVNAIADVVMARSVIGLTQNF